MLFRSYYADANRAKMMEAQAHLAHYGNLGNLQDRQEKMQTLQDLRALSNNLATEIKTLAADISKNPAMDNSEKEAQLSMLQGQLRTVNTKLSNLGGITLPEFTPADTQREAAANILKKRGVKFPS